MQSVKEEYHFCLDSNLIHKLFENNKLGYYTNFMIIDLSHNTKIAFNKLREAQQILRNEYSDFAFTLDGKLIGDIGEAIVKAKLQESIKLNEGNKGHDLLLADGTRVQVKTTQKNIVGLGLTKQSFEHLIILKLYDEGRYEIVFDGPGYIVTETLTGANNSIKVDRLRELNNHLLRKIINVNEQL